MKTSIIQSPRTRPVVLICSLTRRISMLLRHGLYICCSLLYMTCSPNPEDVIVVGSKMDTEGAILGYIQLLALQDAGLRAEDRIETGPTLIVRQALLAGEIDGYIEYTGTALVNFMGITQHTVLSDPTAGYQRVKEWDQRQNHVVWLKPWSGINNTYTVLLRRQLAERLGIRSLSDLSVFLRNGKKFHIGVDHEFAAREDGLPGLLETYQLKDLPNLLVPQMDAGLVYQTLKQGSVEAVIGYSTDGRIAAFDLVRLIDDRNFFPVYNPTPIYRQTTLQRFPRIAIILNRIAQIITADDITHMNYQHDVQFARAKTLARKWLKEHGFLKGKDQRNSKG